MTTATRGRKRTPAGQRDLFGGEPHPGRETSGNEAARLARMLFYEMRLRKEGFRRVAGVDEAGAGALAGPVVAAAVIMPTENPLAGVDDSKRLSAAMREHLFREIRRAALAVGIGRAAPREIDRLNIYRASLLAMKRAVAALAPPPDFVLVDARRIPDVAAPQQPVVKGDSLSYSIAAASIVAKVTRDRLMRTYEKRYPGYGFAVHKGYGTLQHRVMVAERGRLPIHRKSFNVSAP